MLWEQASIIPTWSINSRNIKNHTGNLSRALTFIKMIYFYFLLSCEWAMSKIACWTEGDWGKSRLPGSPAHSACLSLSILWDSTLTRVGSKTHTTHCRISVNFVPQRPFISLQRYNWVFWIDSYLHIIWNDWPVDFYHVLVTNIIFLKNNINWSINPW